MFQNKFGLEIEFTGITRNKTSQVVAERFRTDARAWKIVRDSSIRCEKKEHGRIVSASRDYSVEVVSPILSYREDIDSLQNLVRALRKAGAFPNSSCGIHIHLDGSNHTPTSIRNFINIIASYNDLFYKALQIEPARMEYCRQMDAYLVEKINRLKPKTFQEIEDIWYARYAGNREFHYHNSRYHFLNLHSFFHGKHTVELRGFNSTLHAGKIRAYIVLALALNHQALTQKSARYRKVQHENEKFAMRVYLNRIGFIGDEFKNCREHLYQHLDGNAAWRYGSRESVRTHRNGGMQNDEN